MSLNTQTLRRSQNVKQEGWLPPTERASAGQPIRPWDHRGKRYMVRKRIQCLSNASQHVPIYLQPFLRYSGISVASEWFSTVLVSDRVFFNHILLSPVHAPGTIEVNVTWIEREFNAFQTHRSMYTPIFNRLRAIARYWSEIATFSYPLAFKAPVRSGPWDNRSKCRTVGKRIQCL